MVNDRFMLGLLAGFAGNLVKEASTWLFHFLGLVRYTFVHIGAGCFVSAEFVDDPVSLVTGLLADWTVAGAFGILLVYLLIYTGADHPVAKGAFLGAAVYVLLYGAFMALGVTRATMVTPLPSLLLFFPHIALGIVAGWTARRYGREVLGR